MTVRLEWLDAKYAQPYVGDVGEEASDGQYATRPGDLVLEISSGDSYGCAIEGSRDELLAFLERCTTQVRHT